jgi:hypothetical protein
VIFAYCSKLATARVSCRIPGPLGCRYRPYAPFRDRVERDLIRVSLERV